MKSKQKLIDEMYMTTARAHAARSTGVRGKVGACLVTSNGVMLAGYNGLAPGNSNVLEYVRDDGSLKTKSNVIHAELNSILKAAREGVSVLGGTMYVTMSPCLSCSEMLVAAGVSRVVYEEEYRDRNGIENLITSGVLVEKLDG